MIRMSKNLVYRSKARPRSSVSAWISLFVVGSGFFGKNKSLGDWKSSKY
ncbi:hypothetical protein MANES_02G016567v8 [Manihot esculenta]|uniref:Uncharacterized protein n=2 Tax=Manihot esculenta TaxID=3983 RepID=A0ACB7I3W0_MANES|nr:hypothetical protein MANES_02G016567v8 [Manihot esculenta]KAG8659103.1 hypothetical protein MANES_02G016567v8 [Manihot esculenta]